MKKSNKLKFYEILLGALLFFFVIGSLVGLRYMAIREYNNRIGTEGYSCKPDKTCDKDSVCTVSYTKALNKAGKTIYIEKTECISNSRVYKMSDAAVTDMKVTP